ncbi:MAG: hypothetical protein CVV31_01365 [Methanomicrobiales archaeon HGW-Methanomicrobiales-2]|nr:MAG: hypothetical protein CVV31_01365 [Methanomicrobiales archaeon HGW-Methanomicrobiales-2]
MPPPARHPPVKNLWNYNLFRPWGLMYTVASDGDIIAVIEQGGPSRGRQHSSSPHPQVRSGGKENPYGCPGTPGGEGRVRCEA